MRVLFDNGTPRGFAAALKDHVVEEARARGWDTLRNGELLDAAVPAGFEVFVTTDERPVNTSPAFAHTVLRTQHQICNDDRSSILSF